MEAKNTEKRPTGRYQLQGWILRSSEHPPFLLKSITKPKEKVFFLKKKAECRKSRKNNIPYVMILVDGFLPKCN